jgi:hypothetical protein
MLQLVAIICNYVITHYKMSHGNIIYIYNLPTYPPKYWFKFILAKIQLTCHMDFLNYATWHDLTPSKIDGEDYIKKWW